jgi:hypothetical protein
VFAALVLAGAPTLKGQFFREDPVKKLTQYRKGRENIRRALIAIRSTEADFLGSMGIAGDTVRGRFRDPEFMRHMAAVTRIAYRPAWDARPQEFYAVLLDWFEQEVRSQAAALGVEHFRPEEGPYPVERDEKGRPVVTDKLIARYLRAEYSKTQTGGAPWRAGGFSPVDYEDVAKRIEWARTVKRSQGGESLVSTPAMREQFSDPEIYVLNNRWQDLENAQNGRWNEVNW